MSKEMFVSFIVSHRVDYTRIGNYAKKHGITISLGDCPNCICIDEDIPAFKSYMKRYRDFSVVVK